MRKQAAGPLVTAACCVLLGLTALSTASACNILVYEYALMQWMRAPYRICYFYKGTESEADAPVISYLEKVSRPPNGHGNLAVSAIEVGELAKTGAGSLAHHIWSQHKSQKLPFYVILTPRGYELFVGRLDLANAKALVSSPKRRQMAEALSGGKHGMVLLLQGSDAAANAEAEGIVRQAIAAAKEYDLDIGFLSVGRKDAKEKWLVRQLLLVEEDLAEFDSPMVFGVFGRGHVLEPFLARGITEGNLMALVQFITGPCSCEVKSANIGVDLLTNWDWESHIAGLEFAPPDPEEWALFDIEEEPADEGDTDAETTVEAPAPSHEHTPTPQPREAEAEATDDADGPAEAAERHQARPQPPRDDRPGDDAEERGAEETDAPTEPAGEDDWDLERAANMAFGAAHADAGSPAEPRAPQPRPLRSVLARRVAVAAGIALILVAAAGLVLVKRAKEA